MKPIVVSVSGTSSEVGKTTLICDLLRLFTDWEAIKVTRGHFRSCGRVPDACCVSPMLGERPLVLSGRDQTFKPGKDTGRFWEAGASNVHWVVATTTQVEEGYRIALERVAAPGVLVEGTSFLANHDVGYSIMVTTVQPAEVKSSALRMMPRMNAVYLSYTQPRDSYMKRLRGRLGTDAPVYSRETITQLTEEILKVNRNANPGITGQL